MPIRPIEIMQSQEASQIKHVDSLKTQHEQVQISRNFQNQIQKEQTKTVETTKSENKEYRYDAKEKGNNSYFNSGSGKKQKEQDDKKKESKEPKKSGGFDILI